MEYSLVALAVLSGIAAIIYLIEKFRSRTSSAIDEDLPNDPYIKWIDTAYLTESELEKRMSEQGYQLRWSNDNQLNSRVEHENWKIVNQEDETGKLYIFKRKSNPYDQTLIMKKKD